MQLRPEEISKIIKDQIKHYDNRIVQSDVGTVLLVGDGIARVSGLENCMANELVRFSTGSCSTNGNAFSSRIPCSDISWYCLFRLMAMICLKISAVPRTFSSP